VVSAAVAISEAEVADTLVGVAAVTSAAAMPIVADLRPSAAGISTRAERREGSTDTPRAVAG
jgi:hypothetical protein